MSCYHSFPPYPHSHLIIIPTISSFKLFLFLKIPNFLYHIARLGSQTKSYHMFFLKMYPEISIAALLIDFKQIFYLLFEKKQYSKSAPPPSHLDFQSSFFVKHFCQEQCDFLSFCFYSLRGRGPLTVTCMNI